MCLLPISKSLKSCAGVTLRAPEPWSIATKLSEIILTSLSTIGINALFATNFSELEIETPLHQYIFNIGSIKCRINLNNALIDLGPEDSIYIKPNLIHSFIGKGSKLLILRVGGKISGDALFHFSMISRNNLSRSIEDNLPWFNQ